MSTRLFCRPPQQSDLDFVFQLYTDARTGALSPVAALTTSDDAQAMLSEWIAHWQAHDFGPWMISLYGAPEQLIGCGGLSLRDFAGECLPNLWYRFDPAVWGQGYASEFVQAALKHFQDLHRYREVHALVLPKNVASIRVLEKSGLQAYGELSGKNGADASLRYRLQF